MTNYTNILFYLLFLLFYLFYQFNKILDISYSKILSWDEIDYVKCQKKD